MDLLEIVNIKYLVLHFLNTCFCSNMCENWDVHIFLTVAKAKSMKFIRSISIFGPYLHLDFLRVQMPCRHIKAQRLCK